MLSNKEYYELNKEKISQQHKDYYELNKEKIILQKKQNYEANKEKILLQKKQYRAANKVVETEARKEYKKKWYEEHKYIFCDGCNRQYYRHKMAEHKRSQKHIKNTLVSQETNS